MSDNDTTDGDAEPTSNDDAVLPFSRRDSLAALGAAGLGGLGLFSGTAGARGRKRGEECKGNGKGSDGRPWNRDVDARGHALTNLGSLSMADDDATIRDFTGEHLTVDDEGVLHADEVPDTIHYVNNYPGDTLDEKFDAVLDEIVSTAGSQAGHRIIVPPPEPDDPASTDGGPIWRFENPVEVTGNVGKFTIEMGWTLIFATDTIESFFIIGPDEKTENITIDGGFLYAQGNVEQSFVDIQGIGHMQIYRMYLQSLEGRNSVPAGIRLADKHGSSEISVYDTEVTGCTDAFLAEQQNDVPYGAAFDLDIYNWRGGGGENSIRIDGGVGITLQSIQAGGHPLQSVSDSIVKLENSTNAVRNIDITHVRERHNAMDFHSGVRAVDVTDGEGAMHDGVYIEDVDCYHAEYGTDLEYVSYFDQQNLRPAPAPIGDASEGTTRRYGDSGQVFDSTKAHTFEVGGERAAVIDDDGLTIAGDGEGPIVRTPDGSARYRIGVDNDGNLVTEELDSE